MQLQIPFCFCSLGSKLHNIRSVLSNTISMAHRMLDTTSLLLLLICNIIITIINKYKYLCSSNMNTNTTMLLWAKERGREGKTAREISSLNPVIQRLNGECLAFWHKWLCKIVWVESENAILLLLWLLSILYACILYYYILLILLWVLYPNCVCTLLHAIQTTLQ